MEIRSLSSIAEFRDVIALEREIWGGEPEDAVGIPIFAVTLKRGGILIGAYQGDRLAGFVYSFAAMKAGRPVQWSHMLGVRDGVRGTGLGRALKLAQREQALAAGFALMEWTFDPLQAANAHLNFRRLGVVADEYLLNVYGESTSPLHGAMPTDRLVALWRLRSPRVSRLAGDVPAAADPGAAEAGESPEAVVVLDRAGAGERVEPVRADLGRSEPALAVRIPGAFTGMLGRDPGPAAAWRAATREVFGHYLGRGYHVVDFALDGEGGGTYRLCSALPADLQA